MTRQPEPHNLRTSNLNMSDNAIGAIIAVLVGLLVIYLVVVTLPFWLSLLGAFLWLRHLLTRRFTVGAKTGLAAGGLGLLAFLCVISSFDWTAAGALQCLVAIWFAVLAGALTGAITIQGSAYYILFWPHRRAILRSLRTSAGLLARKVRMWFQLRDVQEPIRAVERQMQADLRAFESAQAALMDRVNGDDTLILAGELSRLERAYVSATPERIEADLQSALAAANGRDCGNIRHLRVLFLRTRVHLARVNGCARGDFHGFIAARDTLQRNLVAINVNLRRLASDRNASRAMLRTIRSSRPALA